MSESPTNAGDQLVIFRPGETARRLPRWQFGLFRSGRCGATLTYPIPDFPWRHNVQESFEATVDSFTVSRVFEEVEAMPSLFRTECLEHDNLWSDMSEKANGITRDKATNTLCFTFMIPSAPGLFRCNYAMREDSPALLESITYRLVSGLIAPYLDLYPDGRTRRCRQQPLPLSVANDL
jgi:hypothetical protein